MNTLRTIIYTLLIFSTTHIVGCKPKIQNDIIRFPLNCSTQILEGNRVRIINDEISLEIPEGYTIYDSLMTDQIMLFRTIPYKADLGLSVDIFKVKNKVSFEEIKNNIRQTINSKKANEILNEDFKIKALDRFEHQAFSYIIEGKNDTLSNFTAIYISLNYNVYGIWIVHNEPIAQFDYKEHCEIINILSTLEVE